MRPAGPWIEQQRDGAEPEKREQRHVEIGRHRHEHEYRLPPPQTLRLEPGRGRRNFAAEVGVGEPPFAAAAHVNQCARIRPRPHRQRQDVSDRHAEVSRRANKVYRRIAPA